MDIDKPEIVAEVRASFDGYNAAIEKGDATALNGYFWNAPNTVRFGHAEHLFGYEAISTYRSGQWKPGAPRRLERLAITTLGTDFATTWAIFRPTSGAGPTTRQSQTWARMPEGWRIIAAHVSATEAA
jgi:hypothetical protein